MKRLSILLLLIFLTVTLFAGGKQPSMGAAGPEPVTLNVLVRDWVIATDAPFWATKDSMEQKYPHVTIEIEGLGYDDMHNKQQLAIGSDQQLDVIQVDNPYLSGYVEAGLIVSISDMMNRDKEMLDDLLPTYRKTTMWKGDYYGYWLATDTRVLAWNKKFVAAAGLDPEKGPETYEELIANAVKAQNPPEYHGYYVPLGSWEATVEKWLTPLYSLGGTITDDDFGTPSKAVLNEAEGVRALQLYVDMVNKHKIMSPVAYQSDEADEVFWGNKVVYCYDPYPWWTASEVGWSMEKYYEHFGKSLNPRFKDGKIATQSGGYLLSVAKTTADEELSWEFIKTIMQPENLLELYIAEMQLPVTASMSKYVGTLSKIVPYYELYLESQQYTHFNPFIPQWAKMLDPIYTAIQKATLQKASTQEALNEAADQINSILASK
jgi:multiple sugar transport system substrate-binding protein